MMRRRDSLPTGDSLLSGLDPAKAAQLRLLFASLPDAIVAALAPALKAGVGRSVASRQVSDFMALEREDRAVRDLAFAPLAPLVRRAAADPTAPLPPDALFLLWRTLRREAPGMVEVAVRDLTDLTRPDDGRRAADALAEHAAAALSGSDQAWIDLRAALDARRPGGADALALHLALAPLARRSAPRLRNWLRTASLEHASALKLAYRDAAAVAEDAPPRLLEMLAAQLDQDWQVLRLITAVMDRPRDSFLAASELGHLGEAVLDDVDARVQAVRAFDPSGGLAAGDQAAEAACAAVQALSEFDRSIELRPDGPWARRIAAQRRNLSRGVETRLKQADQALGRALPVITHTAPGQIRGAPRLDGPLDPLLCAKAEGLVAFVVGVRSVADYGGFAVLRAKAAEAIDLRLSLYADDLVQAAHEGEPAKAEEARARLKVVADLLGRVRDSKAAQVIRRRAAAA